MPEDEQFTDLFQKLEQLNRLEEEQELARRSGHSALDPEARMESLRSNIPVNVLAGAAWRRSKTLCAPGVT
jgi:hypothetical protein